MEIDFESHELCLLENVSVAKSDTVIPLKVCRDSFCVPVGINNETAQWMRLDTGCATALQRVTANFKTCAQTGKPAVGLAAFTIPQAATTVFLGGRRFDQVPTGIHRSVIFPGEAGLLGNGLLDRFKTVTIDAKSGRLVLGQPFFPN